MGRTQRHILYLAYDDDFGDPPTRFHHLSAELSGTVVAPGQTVRSLQDDVPAFGRFRYVPFRSARRRGLFASCRDIAAYVRTARALVNAGERYDLIVTAGLFKTAVAGLILRRLIASPVLMELTVVPRKIVQHRSPGSGFLTAARAVAMERIAAVVLARADHIKQIFPGQLAQISRRLARTPSSAFPDFTAVSSIEPSQIEDYLLLIGTPLHLKGADLAIRAFKKLLPGLTHERLRIVGSSAGFAHLRPLVGPGDPIEFVDYLPHAQALEQIRSAKVVLIPSRTDAMPRVAVEAMAAGKAIVASRVDGMPAYLEDGRTALLCAAEDPDDLAARLGELLRSPELRRRLGTNARQVAQRAFGEPAYVRQYVAMVSRCAAAARQTERGTHRRARHT